MVCHGELVLLKPEPRRLTEFYLFVAAGGALGGVLVEHRRPLGLPLLFRMAAGLVPGLYRRRRGADAAGDARRGDPGPGDRRSLGGHGAGVPPFVATRPPPSASTACGTSTASSPCGNTIPTSPTNTISRLVHGNIAHGQQFVAPAKRRRPTMYYAESSGVGRAIRCLQKQRPAMRVGVVGLGVGTLAAYAREGDEYEFFEINPEVPRLARKYFTYLAECRGKCGIVLGDARLSLERPSSQKFDLLALDAFSGDSIPTHLLTREALAVYLRRAPGGLIAVHVTNTYLGLAGGAGGGRGRQTHRRASLRRWRQRLGQPQRLDARGAGGRIVDGPCVAAPAAPPRRPSRPAVDRSVQQPV